jgi:CBS domain-containing protein
MDPIMQHQKLKIDSPIRKVIDIFRETKFAFIPIMKIGDSKKSYPNDDGNTEDEEIVGVLSIRDFLPLFSRSATSSSTNNAMLNRETSEALSITAEDISSDLVSVNKNASIKEATNIMINSQIRNIGIKDKDSNLIGLINDRIVLEFLLRYMRTQDSSSIIDPENNIRKAYYKEDIVGGTLSAIMLYRI